MDGKTQVIVDTYEDVQQVMRTSFPKRLFVTKIGGEGFAVGSSFLASNPFEPSPGNRPTVSVFILNPADGTITNSKTFLDDTGSNMSHLDLATINELHLCTTHPWITSSTVTVGGNTLSVNFVNPVLIDCGVGSLPITPVYVPACNQRIFGVDASNFVRTYKDGPNRRSVILG